MRSIFSVLSLVAVGTLVGCGQASSAKLSVLPEKYHGGILIPLTDNQAYVELLNGDRQKKGDVYDTTLIAFLFQPDLKAPFSETPTSVAVKIGTPKGEQVVALKAAPDSSDPVDNARFISTSGPFELNQVGGEVTVQLADKKLSGTFRGPR